MSQFVNDLNTFVVHTICFTNRGITNKYNFNTLCIKFTKILLTIIVDEVLTCRGLEISYDWFLAFEQFIWCLFEDGCDKVPIKNIIYSINNLVP